VLSVALRNNENNRSKIPSEIEMAYSMNGDLLLWKGKPAKLKSAAKGRTITDTMATDGTTLYHAQKRVELPPEINLETLLMRVFDENAMNLSLSILTDGSAVWYLDPWYGREVRRLPYADFGTVERFQNAAITGNYHLRDHQRVWYRGSLIEGLTASAAKIIAENVASDGENIWVFGKLSPELKLKDISVVWSSGETDLVRTDDALLRLDAKTFVISVLARSLPLPGSDEIAQTAMHALARDMFGVFDTYPQIIVPIEDLDFKRTRAKPQYQFNARFDGSKLALEAGGIETITCEPDGWYRGLCTLWLRLHNFPGSLVTYPELGSMLPDGQEFRHRLIKSNADAYLKLCAAALTQGAKSQAQLMLHAYVTAGWHRSDTPFDKLHSLVASLPRSLFESVCYVNKRDGFRNPTNLSAARHAVSSGLLADPDPRVRLEMLELIHATILGTNKRRQFFQHVLPAVLERLDLEQVAMVAEHADTVIEAFLISGLVHAEVYYEPMADLLEPLVHRQISRGINVPLNQSRLIEVLIHQERQAEAEEAISRFKAEYGADFMLPGIYTSRPLHKNVDEAVAAMRERASELQR
jgi:hypothetical protein